MAVEQFARPAFDASDTRIAVLDRPWKVSCLKRRPHPLVFTRRHASVKNQRLGAAADAAEQGPNDDAVRGHGWQCLGTNLTAAGRRYPECLRVVSHARSFLSFLSHVTIPKVPLRTGRRAGVLGLIRIAVLATAAPGVLPVTGLYAVKSAALMALVMSVATVLVRTHHPFSAFGTANQMTTVLAALVALVGGLIGEPAVAPVAAAAVTVAVIVVMLDGTDGWLARRSDSASQFGARFDMEVDALLIMALSILVWQHGKAGGWVLLSGLLRYAFVAAGWIAPWLARPLPPSRRRQTVCVVQIVALCVVLAPVVPVAASTIVAATALLALAASFLIDVIWLWRARPGSQPARLRLAALGAALVVLNASLAFRNLADAGCSLARRPVGRSGGVRLAMALLYQRFGPISRRALR